MIRVLIVDDEPHACRDLAAKLSGDERFSVIGLCGNAFEAIREINKHKPDVVFLDIKMPKVSGIEMLSMLDPETMPRIVFVTAHGEYAIEAFEENAIDFLLKPVSEKRLALTLARLLQDHAPQPQLQQSFATALKFVPCYLGGKSFLINIEEVMHIYSSPTSGIHLLTADPQQEFHTSVGLKVFEQNSTLLRCHRQHMVNPAHIKWIEKCENGLGQIHLPGERTVPVSRAYMAAFPALC